MVLGGLAEFERELIRSRTSEGRERAKARGVVMGHKPKLTTTSVSPLQGVMLARRSWTSLAPTTSAIPRSVG
jgi:DNA invertase Pin-like site-specific DNA recombinase